MANPEQNLSLLIEKIQEFHKWKESQDRNLDQFFLAVMGILIYFLQAGFALLEAGAVRSKNTTNILIKNLMDSFSRQSWNIKLQFFMLSLMLCSYGFVIVFAAVSYWLFGYAFAYGKGNSFIGYTYFAHSDMPNTDYVFWFYQYVFAATSATIVSGAVAERCDFYAYIIYNCILTGFVYPVVTHWVWSGEGWLNRGQTYTLSPDDGGEFTAGYVDFAGSGVVHMLGGISAFLAASALGPRIGKFDKETGRPVDIKGHSVPLAALGGFILLFGFFAFNGSSQGHIAQPGDGVIVAIAIKNTALSATGGAFTALIMNKTYFGDKKWSFLTTLNGCLTGMVSICGGCNQYHSYSAFAVGVIGGVSYMITTWLTIKMKVDDPLDATAVHVGGGVWGALAVPFFSTQYGIIYKWNKRSGYHLAWQLAGMASIFAWTSSLCFIMFFTLRKLGIFRVSFEYEIKGLDIPKHGEAAYPAESYGHGWGEKGDALAGLVKSAVSSSVVFTNRDVPRHIMGVQAAMKNTENPELDAAKRNSSVCSLSGSMDTIVTNF